MIDYIIAKIKEKAENRDRNLRYGQAVFIETHKIFPREADILTGSTCDCFYYDELVDYFLDKVKSLVSPNAEELLKKFNNADAKNRLDNIARERTTSIPYMYRLGETMESLKFRGGKV